MSGLYGSLEEMPPRASPLSLQTQRGSRDFKEDSELEEFLSDQKGGRGRSDVW
jgi:hypothetical protein